MLISEGVKPQMLKNKKKKNVRPIILYDDLQFELKEAYKALRTNLQFASIDSKVKSVLLTSSRPMEGKTTVSVNLSITLAQAGYKVLLVDADMRKPRVHTILRLPSVPGLTNCLVSGVALEEIVRKSDYGMDVIVCGSIPPNSSELLGSDSMKSFIKKAESIYDYVILDTPPSVFITDAAVLSKHVDGVLFIVRYGSTNVELVKVAKENLEKVEARIIGCIINDAEIKGRTGYYSHSYGGSYYKYATHYNDN